MNDYNQNEQEIEMESPLYKCTICGFIAKNSVGLASHIRFLHIPNRSKQDTSQDNTVQRWDTTKSIKNKPQKTKNKVVVSDKSIKVYDKKGVYIRTYAEKKHGKDYFEKAKEFCKKNSKKGFHFK